MKKFPQIRARQIDSLKQMLSLNNTEESPEWKVLVLDLQCRDLIAPQLKLNELRKLGVTLSLQLHNERQPIPDAPAVYFVAPTAENVARICQDCQQRLYRRFYINFAGEAQRVHLEQIASSVPRSLIDEYDSPIKIYDQFLNFTALEDDLFTLEIPNSFVKLNNLTDEKEALSYVKDIATGICSMLLSIQQFPVIATLPGDASQHIAEEVARQLVDLNNESFFGPNTGSRPVLVLCERSENFMSSMLYHSFSYRCMLTDLLGMHLNKVSWQENNETKSFDMDINDTFWAKYSGQELGDVFNATQQELEKLDESKKSINNSDDVSVLSSAMSQMPQFTEKKKTISTHLTLNNRLLQVLRNRSLLKDTTNLLQPFHDAEDTLIFRSPAEVNVSAIEKLVLNKEFPASDRLRLMLISECNDECKSKAKSWTEQSLGEYQGIMDFIMKRRKEEADNSNQSQVAKLKSALGKFGTQIGLAKGSNLLPITRIVDALTLDSQKSEKRDLILSRLKFIDPRYDTSEKRSNIDIKNIRFSNVIVFFIGGGTDREYQNLKEWEADQLGGKSVVYGATELLSPEKFLKQISDTAAQLKR